MTVTTASSMQVGFIGLGDIGLPMACRLAKAGFQLLVHDMRQAQVAQAVASGARAASSVKQIALECRFILIVVVDEGQIRSLLEGGDGIFRNASPGTILVCHSTLPPDVAQQLGSMAESKGYEWLDAPMSGGSVTAAAGELAFLVGGKAKVIENCQPLLDAMGARTFNLGAIGAGQVGKLVNAAMCHLGYVVAMESLHLAAAYGIPEEQIVALARVSTGNSWVMQNWGHMERTFSKRAAQGFTAEYESRIRKDLAYVLKSGRAAHVALPLTALGTELYPNLVKERLMKMQSPASVER